MTDKRRETDLYQPVRDYLGRNGYDVYSEVEYCDITAVKDGELLVVELKLAFGMELLLQGVTRQKAADSVYLAIPRPRRGMRTAKWRDILHLLRRLELGLITVSLDGPEKRVDVVLHPKPFDRQKSRRAGSAKRLAIIREIEGRSDDYNVGGTRGQLVTAYRENCIQIACLLDKLGPLTPKTLRELGTGPKTQSILAKNHYGWFERIARGVYCLTEKGRLELAHYPTLTEHWKGKISRDHKCQSKN